MNGNLNWDPGNKIEICNLILTRRCNLNCSYCAITKNYANKPSQYPDMKHYQKFEMNTDYVKECLRRLKLHNKDVFIIIYGGEPLLREDLPDIINYCNKEKINYTIITNNTEVIQPRLKRLFENVDYVTGLSSSVDPLVETDEPEGDRYKKCIAGFNNLQKYKGQVKDLVAEMTVDNNNVKYMYDLVCSLHDAGINTDITFIDIAKNEYYDFSNITDEKLLVKPTTELKNQLDRIVREKLDVHMAEKLLPEIYNILPSNLNCEIEKNVHSIAIDADGTVRLCLRCRGTFTPRLRLTDYINRKGNIDSILNHFINVDKRNYCQGCNHTCYIHSKLVSRDENLRKELIHSNKRNI